MYLDLDPERFATAPARASQISSLLDSAAKQIDLVDGLGHRERIDLREDLQRVRELLSSPEAPFKGARALAVFCSTDLFEVFKLSRSVPSQVVVDQAPYVEPMVGAVENRRWLVALVNRRSARVLAGSPAALSEGARVDDGVRGRHDQGGWSQANYERSIEKDVEDHLRHVAGAVNHRWLEERFDRIATGGPQEIVPRFEELLSEEVRVHLARGKVEVDISTATEAQIRAAVEQLVAEDEKRAEREALDRLGDGIGAGGRATGGPRDTLQALNERRVSTLLLEPGFDGLARRCPRCGMLVLGSDDRCPADGTELQEIEHLREAVVEAALAQDADVMTVRFFPDLGPHRGIASLLRF
jgi:peptide subunit release factor 1 (eRF1)